MGYKNDITIPEPEPFVFLTQEIKSRKLNSGLNPREAAYYRSSGHDVGLRVFTSPRGAVTNNH